MTEHTFHDGRKVGACWICGKQMYPNKPASARKLEDMKAVINHIFDEHPEEVFRRYGDAS